MQKGWELTDSLPDILKDTDGFIPREGSHSNVQTISLGNERHDVHAEVRAICEHCFSLPPCGSRGQSPVLDRCELAGHLTGFSMTLNSLVACAGNPWGKLPGLHYGMMGLEGFVDTLVC